MAAARRYDRAQCLYDLRHGSMTLASARAEKQGREKVVTPAGADTELASKALSLRDKVHWPAAVDSACLFASCSSMLRYSSML